MLRLGLKEIKGMGILKTMPRQENREIKGIGINQKNSKTESKRN